MREGVRATRLAARIGDIAKYPDKRATEKQAALARRDSDWEAHFSKLMFEDKAREVRASRVPDDDKTCTMCGDFCAMQRGMTLFEKDISEEKKLGGV